MTTLAGSTEPITETLEEDSRFQTGRILTIVGGHFIHDTYSAFVAPLLPLLIDKFTLTLTQAGSLSIFAQLPSLLSIVIGYLADRFSLRYLVIFAPAVTATLITALGQASSYFTLAILLFVAGVSIMAFHAPAPAMIGQISGRQLGKGMSLFMAGGELGRTMGPLLVVWGISEWGLEGIWRLALIGWVASALLFWRLHDVSAYSKRKRSNFREALPQIKRMAVPLFLVMFFRSFVVTGLSVFLVVLLESEGYSLIAAGQALALWSFAGVGGALIGGTISDRIGRKQTLVIAILSSSLLLLVFLAIGENLVLPTLILLGLTGLSITPVLQAVTLEQLPDNRATASGLFIFFAFVIRAIATLLIGIMGDLIGLRSAFAVCAILALIAVPLVFMLPDLEKRKRETALE